MIDRLSLAAAFLFAGLCAGGSSDPDVAPWIFAAGAIVFDRK